MHLFSAVSHYATAASGCCKIKVFKSTGIFEISHELKYLLQTFPGQCPYFRKPFLRSMHQTLSWYLTVSGELMG